VSWDAFQREALEALGHSVFRLADAGQDAAELDIAALTPLQRAVLRAAARSRPDASLLSAANAVRANAAAKRALWPRLRALRRGDAG